MRRRAAVDAVNEADVTADSLPEAPAIIPPESIVPGHGRLACIVLLVVGANYASWELGCCENVDLRPLDVTGNGSRLLLLTRALSAILVVSVSINLFFTSDYPLFRSNHGHLVHHTRWRRFTTFTVWAWTLLGIYFCSATALTASSSSPPKSAWLPILYEICFAMALLVTTVVHFVLIPAARRKDPYKYKRAVNWRALTVHYANSFMILLEALLSGLPVRRSHWVFMLLVANAYLIFALVWHRFTGLFYYFFLDYTRFWWAPLAYAGMLLLMAGTWLVATTCSDVLNDVVRPALNLT